MQANAPKGVLRIRRLCHQFHTQLRAARETEWLCRNEQCSARTRFVLRIDRPHAPVPTQRIGYPVIAIRLFHIRPRPRQRNALTLGGILHRHGLHFDGVQHGITIGGSSNTTIRKRWISHRLQRDSTQVGCVGAVRERLFIVGWILTGGKHTAVGLQCERGLLSTDRRDKSQRGPVNSFGTDLRAKCCEGGVLGIAHRITRRTSIGSRLRQNAQPRSMLWRGHLDGWLIGTVGVHRLRIDARLFV